MREIDRNKVAMPGVLDLLNPGSLAAIETARAIAHFEAPGGGPKPKFKVYSHDEVKEALIDLFDLKCAYCETKVVSARDIEHFRPKGRIRTLTGAILSPGYYWLAADWNNLLLSCPDCNQNKRALERDANGKWTFVEISTGKLDQFPLLNEANRVRHHAQNISAEETDRLLLNPCNDPVRKHLRFDADGNILPRQLNGQVSEMAKVSIGVYVLHRQTLVEARKARYLDIIKCKADIEFASRMIEHTPASDKDLLWDRLTAYKNRLEAFTAKEEAFLQFSHFHIKKLKIENELAQAKKKFNTKFPP